MRPEKCLAIISLLILLFTISCSNSRNPLRVDSEFFKEEIMGTDNTGGNMEITFPYYPDTDQPPVLTFKWETNNIYGPLNLSTNTNGHIYSCGPFGVEEEPGFYNQEMAIFFVNRHREPIYTFCEGVITYLSNYYCFTDAMRPGKGGEVWIRYGRNWAIGFRHVVTSNVKLQLGQKVERGEIVGYTADMDINGRIGSFYEFVVVQKDGNKYYYCRGYDYFDDESKNLLLDIWNAAQDKNNYGYDTVTNPWGDLLKFESESGNHEIPFKGAL